MKFLVAFGAVAAIICLANPAGAMTSKQCTADYKAAQAAGSLNGMKWVDFRKSKCGFAAPTTSGQALMPGERPATSVSSWGAPTAGGRPQ